MSAVSQNRFSVRSFSQGLIGVALLYLLLAGISFFKKDDTLALLERDLASERVSMMETIDVLPLEVKEPITHQADGASDHDEMHEVSENTHDTHAAIDHEDAHEPPSSGSTSSNTLSPFISYKKSFRATGKPLIAIVVRDTGLSQSLSDRLIDSLPDMVSFMLSPYSADPQLWQTKAAAADHETWLEIPIASSNFPYADHGPNALSPAEGLTYNMARLEEHLSKSKGYAGVSMFVDASFSATEVIFKGLLGTIADKGFGYLDLNAQAPKSARGAVQSRNGPYVQAHLLYGSDAHIDTFLKAAEDKARANGFAVAVLPAHLLPMKRIVSWTKSLDANGFSLAPLSALTPFYEAR